MSDCLHNWEYGDGLRECYGCGTVQRANGTQYVELTAVAVEGLPD